MTGLYSTKGFPTKGWTALYIDDREAAHHVCEACGTRRVRFVHVMQHPDYADDVFVGCICAASLSEGYEARKTENRIKSGVSRFAKGWQEVGYREHENVWKGVTYRVFWRQRSGWHVAYDDYQSPGYGNLEHALKMAQRLIFGRTEVTQ